MTDNVIEWLLERDNPSVRFFTLTSLLDMSPSDKEVKNAKKTIMKCGIVAEMLSKQNSDGSWGIPGKFYRQKYEGTVWNLIILAEMSADPADIRIKNACEFILRHSQEPLSGGFSYDESAKTGSGISSGVVPCLTGNMVYSLTKLGYLDDERVQRAVGWILKYQRFDDGIDKAPEGGPYDRYKMCWGKHSCHMGVAKALKALEAIPQERRSIEVKRKIDDMAEYFLKHHIYKKSHSLSEISRPGWLKLGFPLMYQTDMLEILGIFAGLGIKDPRLQDAIDIIKSKRMKDGKWKLESSNNGKMIVDIEKKGAPSKWITLKSLKVLKEYGQWDMGTLPLSRKKS